MEWSTLNQIKSQILNEERKKASNQSYVNTIWLVDVKKLYEKYNVNLGYKRKEAPPRKHRPAIILDKIDENYKVIFLTTSKWGGSPFFDIEYCNYKACPKYFDWISKSKVLILSKKKGKKPRRIFTIKEEDLHEIMTFCGVCSRVYLENIKQKILGKNNV